MIAAVACVEGVATQGYHQQEEFLSRLRSTAGSGAAYAIVTPHRVDEEGRFLSHALRHRRSADAVGDGRSSSSSSPSSPLLHYHLPLLNRRAVHVTLEPNLGLLGPSFVVERRGSSSLSAGLNHRWNATRRTDGHCFFVGNVRNVTGAVALSTCTGLRGVVRLEDGDYLVEPLARWTARGVVEEGTPHPHVVYKRSAIPPELGGSHPASQDASSCGTEDALQEGIAKRERWERRQSLGQRRGDRSKRSVSLERNVETLVVADRTMVEYYSNEDIETYLLTVLNMVSSLYHDASIGNAINVVLVRMILLETDQNKEEDLEINSSADRTLKSFCRWQRFVNPLDENHPNHHDVAILITRYNMCVRNGEPCSTLGLAEVAGMCQPHRSCNVNEDSGLTLAYTIAHEMGHNFGMSHDGPQNGCPAGARGERQHVMAPHLSADASPVVWSECSRHEITRFLDRDWGRCLDDEPLAPARFSFPVLPPGAMYDAHHQCRLQYGPSAKHCPGIEEVCQTLWCRLDNKCVTKMEPAAEGTVCDKNKWCYLGKCTEMGERPEAIDGEWGPWSPWSECSRSCGAGVMFSERHCDNPSPAYGGRYCIGERKRYKMCSTEPCPEDSASFRAVQCSKFNNVPYSGELFNWSPVSTPATPCQLHCKPDGKFFSVMLQESVVDGTPCSPGSRDVCINGKCRRVACDWGIESSAQEDRCGICHGDGTQCITIRKEFVQEEGLGYTEVGKIPAGARNIRIEEVAESSNYLAIQGATDGEFFLNGEWFIQWSGEYAAAGTTLFYQREGEKEILHAPGPIKEDLLIYLLFQSKNPGLKYEYTVPDKNVTRRPEFEWQSLEWTPCTVTCGGGLQVSPAKCMEKEAGLVEDTYCNATERPKTRKRPCNKHPCPARWWTGPWQPCSATCGGTRRRTVLCVRSQGADEQLALLEESCDASTRPTETEPCPGHSRCPEDFAKWDVGNWTQCSQSCGKGQQFREVACIGGVCHVALQPTSVQACNSMPCGTEEGSDVETPNVTSGSPDSSQTPSTMPTVAPTIESLANELVKMERHAEDIPRPTESVVDIKPNVVLDIPLGSGPEDFWNLTGISGLPVDKLPEPHRVVVLEDARYAWRASKWTKCSRACGSGERSRRVKCVDKVTQKEVPEDQCYLHTQHLKPPNRSSCNIDPCLVWQTTEWTKCSVKCGPGSKHREVTCPVHNRCDPAKQPHSVTTCNRGPCFAWVAGPWSQCSTSCGSGTQVRHVRCANQHTWEQYPASACSGVPRPPREQPCGELDCLSTGTQELQQCRDALQPQSCRILRHACESSRRVRAQCCQTCREHASKLAP